MSKELGIVSPETSFSGKKIGIVGGGPAGSFLAYLLAREGIAVDIFEPRSAKKPDIYAGEVIPLCTGCAGLIQKEARSRLRLRDLEIPPNVIQNNLTTTEVHLPFASETIEFPTDAVTVYRGFSPKKQEGNETESFDAWLLREAIKAGAVHHQTAVTAIDLQESGRQKIISADKSVFNEDLVAGTFGYNPKLLKAVTYPSAETAKLDLPKVQRAGIREYYLGKELVAELLDEKLHLFSNPTDSIWFAALIPKGDYITITLMGRRDVGSKDFAEFFANKQVRETLKTDAAKLRPGCGCMAYFTVKSPEQFLVPRSNGEVVMVTLGDAGPTRPRKNGIFAALDSADKLARVLIERGNTVNGLKSYYGYINKTYLRDNKFADTLLSFSDLISQSPRLTGTLDYLINHNTPFVTKALLTGSKFLATGEYPYWQVPIKVFQKTFGLLE